MFDVSQTVRFITDSSNEILRVRNEDLAECLIHSCYSKNIYDLYLGGNQSYIEAFAGSIKTIESMKYNERKINIQYI
jgi:hypothetical protein